MKKIILGEVKKIHPDYLVVLVNDHQYKCTKKNISDYSCDLNNMFKINKKYKFILLKNKNNDMYISYKLGRPKLLKNKNSPTSTISGFKNLSNSMHKYLKDYKFDNES